MVETVIVTFDEEREVFVDGGLTSVTNQRFAVRPGTHTFWLSGDGYRPRSITENIVGTSEEAPFVVSFHAEADEGTGHAIA